MENVKKKKKIDISLIILVISWVLCLGLLITSLCLKSPKKPIKNKNAATPCFSGGLHYVDDGFYSYFITDNNFNFNFKSNINPVTNNGVKLKTLSTTLNRLEVSGTASGSFYIELINSSIINMPNVTFYNFGDAPYKVVAWDGFGQVYHYTVNGSVNNTVSKITVNNNNFTSFMLYIDAGLTSYRGIIQPMISNKSDLTSFEPYGKIYPQDSYDNYGYWQKEEGISEGYDEGLSIAENGGFDDLVYSVIEAPIQIIYNLLNFNILGVNLWALATTILSIALLAWVLKHLKS